MGESTHWYQPELLGSVPSLAARELWNIFVRAGFLSSPLQTFSECTLTERITLQFQSPFPHWKRVPPPEIPVKTHHWPLGRICIYSMSLRTQTQDVSLTPIDSLSPII